MHALVANEPIWKLEHVWLGAGRLCDLTVEICPGITAVIGWSGAGKTSLLNVLAGFENPQRGRVSVSLTQLAWVPQDGGLWPHCTAHEHLTIAGATRTAADELLAAFDLPAKASVRPGQLSQGERSRLSIARALASRAAVVIMDEPLVHVDPARSGKYWRVIKAHLAQTGASLIFSSHVPETVLGHAARALCLRDGRLLHEGPVSELYARPANAELMNFLGPGNWLTPEEALFWLGVSLPGPRCYRPEELALECGSPLPLSDRGSDTLKADILKAAEDCRTPKAFQVESATFAGSFEEVVVREVHSGRSREFFHRPTGPRLAEGMPVRMGVAQ